jgi:hypothetical protein
MAENIERKFKLVINSRNVIDLRVEGDPEIVNSFVNNTLIDTFGVFRDMRAYVNDVIKDPNTLKPRDSKGRFVKKGADDVQ